MREQLTYAIETLRCEFYRITADLNHVPAEMIGYGFSGDMQRERQRQIVEALLILSADITDDIRALLESFRK